MLTVLLILFSLLWIAYISLLYLYRRAWIRLAQFDPPTSSVSAITFSILIPARNDGSSLPGLLQDLLHQEYPQALFEIVVLDDDSTDDTAQMAASFKTVRCISLQREAMTGPPYYSHKKQAIETGIHETSGSWIITLDADVRVGKKWLSSIAAFLVKYPEYVLLAGPVAYTEDRSYLSKFQQTDFLVMQGITGAMSYLQSGSLCNGANLIYRRDAFETVKGFQGNTHISGGDDMFLHYKLMRQFPGRTTYFKCREAIAVTSAQPNIPAFLQQRIRWGAKVKYLQDKRMWPVLLLLFMVNLFFLVVFLYVFIYPSCFVWFLLAWLSKALAEYRLLKTVNQFFQRQTPLRLFLFLQFLHIPYILFTGLLSLRGSYTWKGRKIRIHSNEAV